MSDPRPSTNRRWKYGWNPKGTVLRFQFNLKELIELPDLDPEQPNLKRHPEGYYVFKGPNFVELTLPHNLFRWDIKDTNAPHSHPDDSYLWVKRSNSSSDYLPIAFESDPYKDSFCCYVAFQDYKLSLEASAPVYRKLVFNLDVLSQGFQSIPPIPIDSTFIVQVTVLGDYVDPRSFNQDLHQQSSPKYQDLTITNSAKIANLVVEKQSQNRLDITDLPNLEAPNGEYYPAELNVDLEYPDPQNRPEFKEKAFRVYRGITRATEFRTKKFLTSSNKLLLGQVFRSTSTLPDGEEKVRDLSNYDIEHTSPALDNVIISSGISEATEQNPPPLPVIQFNASEQSWQLGWATENPLPLPNQSPFATKLFTSLYNVARWAQQINDTGSPLYQNAVVFKDPTNPTNLRIDPDIKFLFEVFSQNIVEKTLQGLSQLVLGDRSSFSPTQGKKNAYFSAKQIELGSLSPQRLNDLDQGANTDQDQTRIRLYSEKDQLIYIFEISKRSNGELWFSQISNEEKKPFLRISASADQLILFGNEQTQVLHVRNGILNFYPDSLLILDETYQVANASVETKIKNPSHWNFRSNRLDTIHSFLAKSSRGSLRSGEFYTPDSGHGSIALGPPDGGGGNNGNNSPSPRIPQEELDRPSALLIELNQEKIGIPSARISLRSLFEFLFNKGIASDSDPVVSGEPYKYGLMGRYNPFSPNHQTFELNTLDSLRNLYYESWETGIDLKGGLLYQNQTEHLFLHYRIDELDLRKQDKGAFHLGQSHLDQKPARGINGQFNTPEKIQQESSSNYFTNETTYLGADGKWHYLFTRLVAPVEP